MNCTAPDVTRPGGSFVAPEREVLLGRSTCALPVRTCTRCTPVPMWIMTTSMRLAPSKEHVEPQSHDWKVTTGESRLGVATIEYGLQVPNAARFEFG